MRPAGEAWEEIFRRDGRTFPEPFARFQELAEAFRSYGCRRLLDLGCGSGRHVVALARLGYAVCGLDFSPSGLRLAREWLAEDALGAAIVRADAWKPLPFCDAAFDGILSTQVIHHARLATVRRTIAELRRVLRVGGLLFVTVPAHLEADSQAEEIEPGTYLPTAGSEARVPHHIFSQAEFRAEWGGFRTLDLSLRGSVVLAFLGVKES